MIVSEEVYLQHYGVKGQRWGVKRTLTGGKTSTRGRSKGQVKTTFKERTLLNAPSKGSHIKKHNERIEAILSNREKLASAKSPRAQAQIKKTLNKLGSHPKAELNARYAHRVTVGQNLIAAAIGGPIGSLVVGGRSEILRARDIRLIRKARFIQ